MALSATYADKTSTFQQLRKRDNSVSIHHSHFQKCLQFQITFHQTV